MAKNLIDLLDEDDYDFEEEVGQKRFRIPIEERSEHSQHKKQISKQRKKLRKQKTDIQNMENDFDEDFR